ncbi:serine acetyltransferase [Rhodocyclus tenuis]|uniref:serine O-acetyltransferase n=2 Tax=Rhodocyclus TaxID=1064 RepID=A0A6L5JWF8_RHOTE|nr:serine O-acetyltransferase EpsC [Rhodocyclus gracilis]MQY51122.1 serine acetyltransferase [Rhodocyclus gracilis]MRD71993.1 serine acetyltransferase [Rhodocyclus gracilis]NJA88832.1 serine acetyltransferase [Rhodocyclus gracilis]
MNAPLRRKPSPVDAPPWQLGDIVDELRAAREEWRHTHDRRPDKGEREFPSRDALSDIVSKLCGALFPMRLGPADIQHGCSEDFYVGHTLDLALRALLTQVRLELKHLARPSEPDAETLEARARDIVQQFAAALPGLRRLLDSDVEAAFRGDPAAHSVDEIVLCYPGTLAIIHHRLAHTLHGLGVRLLARIVAELAHSSTGIDIHPGARIGRSFFIDHGTGVVIGETAVIGERVRLYQAVTLGAKRFTVTADGTLEKGAPRHPIVEDDVVVYAGATILGRVTIGRGSSIGGNVWLTHSVPPGSVVTQAFSRNEVMENGAGI